MNEIANLCERGRRRRRRRAPRHRLRPAHRPRSSCSRASATAARASRRTCKALITHGATTHGSTFRAAATPSTRSTTAQKRLLVEKVVQHFGDDARRAAASRVWGLAFKPRTDDMREAPAIDADRGAARPRAPGRRRTIRRRWTRRAKLFGDRISYHRVQLRRARRRRRAAHRHRVERVPAARLRAHEELHASRRSSSTAATSTSPPTMRELGFTYYADRPARRSRSAR